MKYLYLKSNKRKRNGVYIPRDKFLKLKDKKQSHKLF